MRVDESLYEKLVRKPLVDLLQSNCFDFELLPQRESSSDWYRIVPDQKFSIFAAEGCGGHFLTLVKTGHIVYVDTEGSAGIVAANLMEFISLMLAFPYWQDLLHFSGNGRLDAMIETGEIIAATQDEEPDEGEFSLAELRLAIRSHLGISSGNDEIEKLHAAVSNSSKIVSVFANDGSAYASLFNHFVASDNPMWRSN